MRRPSATVGVTNVVVAHRMGASAVSLSARPARIARVSGCSSAIGLLDPLQEVGNDRRQAIELDQEPVVAVRTVDHVILARCALREQLFVELALQMRVIQRVARDRDTQRWRDDAPYRIGNTGATAA